MKKLPTLCFALLLGLSLGDAVQTIGGAVYGDKYLKAISRSLKIAAGSMKEAVTTSVKAAENIGWKPTVVSPETGYVLAERAADVKYAIVTRDYTYRLEVRLPGSGKGDASIRITPPPGLLSSRTMDRIANEYIDSLSKELAAVVNAASAPAAEAKASLEPASQPPAEAAKAGPPAEEPVQPPPAAAPEVKEKKSQRTVITTAALNVRSGPGARSKIIAKLRRGEKVVKLAESGNRIRIRSASGVTGWVSGRLVREPK